LREAGTEQTRVCSRHHFGSKTSPRARKPRARKPRRHEIQKPALQYGG